MAATLKIPTIFTAVDKMSSIFDKMGNKARTFQEKLKNVGKVAAIGGLAIVGALGIASNSAIQFQDKMADVAKTTGLSGKPLDDYGNSLLDMSKKSRTSIDDLLKIGEVGGQLGVASKDLISFTEASNQFAVALGSDYGSTEEAISQVGKINKLFKDTRGLDISSSITKAGSVINQLGAVGSGTSQNINDFILRIGALPDALKPGMVATAALGTFFEEAGIDSQIASSGFSNFLDNAAAQLPRYAQEMGMSIEATKKLFKEDPSAFAQKFAQGLKGIPADQLAAKFNDLKLGSLEVKKVLGALSNDTKNPATGLTRLAELTNVSSEAFKKGTSLQGEYNTKNETTAAKLARAKNNMEAFSITIGTQLLPILGKLIEKVAPIIEKFGAWAQKNDWLGPTLLAVAGGLGAIWVVSKLVAAWTFASSVAMGILGATSGVASIAIGTNTVALTAYNIASKLMAAGTYIATAAQWAWNAAMTANPIGLIIVGVAALIGFIALVIAKWDKWGAAISIFMSPIGLVISIIQSFRRNWEMVKEAFATDGILGGLKAIGLVLLDAILMPVQQLLELLAKIPGMEDLAGSGAKKILELRQGLGVNTGPTDTPALQSPQMTQAQATNETITTQRNNVAIDINDPGGNVKGTSSKGPLAIPVKTTPTNGRR